MTVFLGCMLRQLCRNICSHIAAVDYATQWTLSMNLGILIFLSVKGCYGTSLESVIIGVNNVYCRRGNVLFYFLPLKKAFIYCVCVCVGERAPVTQHMHVD